MAPPSPEDKRQLERNEGRKSNKLNPRRTRDVARWMGAFQESQKPLAFSRRRGSGSEGWVVNAPRHPSMLFRAEAVGRGRLCGRQDQGRFQNNL